MWGSNLILSMTLRNATTAACVHDHEVERESNTDAERRGQSTVTLLSRG